MSALLAYKLDRLIRQIAVRCHDAPDPPGAASWALQELADWTGLKVVLLGHMASPSERLRMAGAEVLDALRHGLADPEDARFTEEASRDMVDALTEELSALSLGDDDDSGGADLEQAWGRTMAG